MGSIFTVPGCTRAPPTDPCPFGQTGSARARRAAVGTAAPCGALWAAHRHAPPAAVAVTLQTSVARRQLQSRSRSKLQSRAANSGPGRSPLPPLSMLARGPGRGPPAPPALSAANSPIPRFRASTPRGPPPFCYSNTTAAGIPREKSGSRGEKVEARTSMWPGRNCAGKAALRGGLHARGFRTRNGSFQRAPRRGLKRILSAPMSILKFWSFCEDLSFCGF